MYDIGSFVVVNNVSCKRKQHNKVIWIDIPAFPGGLGQVVGKCRRFDGIIQGGRQVGFSEWEPDYLDVTKENIFYKIIFGWFNKPVLVHAENMRLATVEEVQDLPKLFTNQKPWTDKDREILSDYSKEFPRDKKGRWCK